MKENIKILPLGLPPITSYHYIADLLGILMMYDEEDYYNWISSNYIQLVIPPTTSKFDYYRLDFFSYLPWKSCPYVYYQRMSRELTDLKWNRIVEFFINCIDLDYYIFVDLDQYYISKSHFYHMRSFPHESFINGYNLKDKVFYIAEFFNGRVFSFEKIPFDEIELAYKGITKLKTVNSYGYPDSRDGIELIKYRNDRKCELRIQQIYNDIEDYLLSKPSCIRYRVPYSKEKRIWDYSEVYGIGVYENVEHFLKYYLTDTENINTYDLRMFHVLYDHKKAMMIRIKFLGERGYINDYVTIYNKYQEIENVCLQTRNLLIKYYLSKRLNIINRMSDNINFVLSEEQKVLEVLLKNMIIP